MANENLKTIVLGVVNENGFGIRATELVMRPEIIELDVESDVLMKAIEELVAEHKLVEAEYVLPNMDYRVKSLYFPAGTQITIRA